MAAQLPQSAHAGKATGRLIRHSANPRSARRHARSRSPGNPFIDKPRADDYSMDAVRVAKV